MNPRLERLLAQLESARNDFTPSAARAAEKLLRSLDAARFPDAPSLIRFHEAVMFFRAFPQGAAVLRASERILNGFHEKVEALRQRGVATDAFDPLEVSGISGTVMEDTLSFDVARWLVHHFPGQVEIAWDNYEPGRELGTTGPRFMPLLEDDSFVEADTPFRRWLETASQRIGQNSNSGAHSTGKSLAGQDETAAAKRRKNAAHGASRGYEADLIKPQRGEKTPPNMPPPFNGSSPASTASRSRLSKNPNSTNPSASPSAGISATPRSLARATGASRATSSTIAARSSPAARSR